MAKADREITPPPSKRRKLELERPGNDTTSTIRIFSWNINGITPFVQKPIMSFFRPAQKDEPKSLTSASPNALPVTASLRSFLHRYAWPHCVLLQEVKINPHDERTRRAVHTAINDRLGTHDAGPEYVVFFTLPRDKHNARGFGGKIYGVASIIRADFHAEHVAIVRDVDWDLEGRVSIIETNDGLALLNIYAVNGTNNKYRDAQTGAVSGTRHDRKRAFHSLLLDECKHLESQGKSVVVAGDLNIARDARDGWPNLRTYPSEHVMNRADFNNKFLEGEAGLRGVDVWRAMKGDERKYTYYPRNRVWGSSCDRVDLVIVSRKLWNEKRISKVGILDSKQERGFSDHVPIYVELQVEKVES
ncbi:exodeoxyribonuclease III [Saccharata proteae CBS 121410]|uniref:Exodeoxyribonuclease III n=1 Tax=Saccharata proteae CBS 121410 TaxID=1314787 RepID=A0A9P4LV27_9PEZI|nr:exodeoxyribonuclease III [Saccharata proteae CBS 121410]